MWEDNPFDKSVNSGRGGGFLPNTDSPAPGGQGKPRRNQNIVPVSIKQLLDCPDDAFVIEGIEASSVSIVGLVRKVETSATKMSMWIDDQSGTLECVIYVGTDGESSSPSATVLCEGTYGRIIGSLRKGNAGKYVLIFRAFPVTDLNEVNAHILEVINTGISLKKLKKAEELKATEGVPVDNSFSNSMIQSGLGMGGPTGTGSGGGGIQGFTANQNSILRIISACQEEEGMHKDQIIAAVKNRMPVREVMEALEFLSNEGHVFSTVDDDHFKSTGSQLAG